MNTMKLPFLSSFPLALVVSALLSACGGGSSSTTTTNTTTTLSASAPSAAASVMQLNYEGFTVWLDCEKRGAVKFQYSVKKDTGTLDRSDSFFLDKNVPANCQQTSASAYGSGYDRGHLVPANHMDSSATSIKATNTMTNILPQAANMNRGAWLLTEEIIDCYRDLSNLQIVGGVIWGNNPADDYFIESHGIKTPDAYWKVVIRGSGASEDAIAWIVPNSSDALRKNLDNYLVSIQEIEQKTGEKIPLTNYSKTKKLATSWAIPTGCNKG